MQRNCGADFAFDRSRWSAARIVRRLLGSQLRDRLRIETRDVPGERADGVPDELRVSDHGPRVRANLVVDEKGGSPFYEWVRSEAFILGVIALALLLVIALRGKEADTGLMVALAGIVGKLSAKLDPPTNGKGR